MSMSVVSCISAAAAAARPASAARVPRVAPAFGRPACVRTPGMASPSSRCPALAPVQASVQESVAQLAVDVPFKIPGIPNDVVEGIDPSDPLFLIACAALAAIPAIQFWATSKLNAAKAKCEELGIPAAINDEFEGMGMAATSVTSRNAILRYRILQHLARIKCDENDIDITDIPPVLYNDAPKTGRQFRALKAKLDEAGVEFTDTYNGVC